MMHSLTGEIVVHHTGNPKESTIFSVNKFNKFMQINCTPIHYKQTQVPRRFSSRLVEILKFLNFRILNLEFYNSKNPMKVQRAKITKTLAQMRQLLLRNVKNYYYSN